MTKTARALSAVRLRSYPTGSPAPAVPAAPAAATADDTAADFPFVFFFFSSFFSVCCSPPVGIIVGVPRRARTGPIAPASTTAILDTSENEATRPRIEEVSVWQRVREGRWGEREGRRERGRRGRRVVVRVFRVGGEQNRGRREGGGGGRALATPEEGRSGGGGGQEEERRATCSASRSRTLSTLISTATSLPISSPSALSILPPPSPAALATSSTPPALTTASAPSFPSNATDSRRGRAGERWGGEERRRRRGEEAEEVMRDLEVAAEFTEEQKEREERAEVIWRSDEVRSGGEEGSGEEERRRARAARDLERNFVRGLTVPAASFFSIPFFSFPSGMSRSTCFFPFRTFVVPSIPFAAAMTAATAERDREEMAASLLVRLRQRLVRPLSLQVFLGLESSARRKATLGERGGGEGGREGSSSSGESAEAGCSCSGEGWSRNSLITSRALRMTPS